MASKARRWLITWNNPDEEYIEDPFHDSRPVKYAVWQLEEGEECKTPHLQMAVFLKTPMSVQALQIKLFGGVKVHCEPMRSPDDAVAYCKKSDTRVRGPWELGTYDESCKQGGRMDLVELRDAAIKRKHRDLIMDDAMVGSYARHTKFVDRVKLYCTPKRDLGRRCDVTILWGPTSTGKTTRAYAMFVDDDDLYVKGSSETWWDGYDGEKNVIIDDFNPGYDKTSLVDWLRILDGRRCMVPIKGAFANMVAEKFVFTSNIPPEMWYAGDPQRDAFFARVTLIEEVTDPEATQPYSFNPNDLIFE